jgi:ParB family chromosome partitioning protein
MIPSISLVYTSCKNVGFHSQRDRRNLTDGEILSCLEVLDKPQPRDADTGKFAAAPDGASDSRSSGPTADTLGISHCKVERARTVSDNADPNIKEAVESGVMSINRAYEETRRVSADI